MTYLVKEIFYSIQGEGAHSGRPAVFCRFSGCNLWSGREEDRETAQCRFCDTDFVGTDGVGGGRFESAGQLAQTLRNYWSVDEVGLPFVILTGGEPTLQVNAELLEALHQAGFEIAIETNGTNPVPSEVDWVCVSPKAGTSLVVRSGDELKVVFPQAGLDPEGFRGLKFKQWFLQPMDGPELETNTRRTTEYCLSHPRWKLSLQTHKILGVQ